MTKTSSGRARLKTQNSLLLENTFKNKKISSTTQTNLSEESTFYKKVTITSFYDFQRSLGLTLSQDLFSLSSFLYICFKLFHLYITNHHQIKYTQKDRSKIKILDYLLEKIEKILK